MLYFIWEYCQFGMESNVKSTYKDEEGEGIMVDICHTSVIGID